ncbi:MAG: anti-sigma factor [Acidimicrobiales bacterium]
MPLEPDDLTDPRDRQRVERLMAALEEEDFARHEPPPAIWDALSARIAADDADDNPGAAPTADRPPEVVTDLGARRRAHLRAHRTTYLAAAAAIVVAVVVAAAVLVQAGGPEERVVAKATLRQLEPLGSTAASARLITRDGTTRLEVDATDMPPAPDGESYELWLIDKGVSDPRSLGVVAGSEVVTVPRSIDPATHPIVDISLEPNDGDHHHSGHSLMRGTLS